MKVRVINTFIDRETRKLHGTGSVIEVTDLRFHEIMAAGDFVEALDDIKPVDKPLEELTLAELKEYAKQRNVKLGNARTKDSIIEAITNALI